MHEHLTFAQQAQAIEPPRDVRAATGTAADVPMAPPPTTPAAAAHAMAAIRTDRPRPRLVHAPLR